MKLHRFLFGIALAVGACSPPSNRDACPTTCLAATTCFEGSCAAVEPGAACQSDADCHGGVCGLATIGFPGGYCSYACNTDNDCGAMGACVPLTGASAACLRLAAAGCRTGYTAVPVGISGPSVCYPDCRIEPGLLCGAYACDTGSGACVGGCSLGGSNAGCSMQSTCIEGAAGGTCECSPATDCGPGRACLASSGACGCADDRLCPSGQVCNLATGDCQANPR